MPKNIELVQQMFESQNPLPSIELAYNALKLGGIAANLYALKSDLSGEVNILLGNIDDVLQELRTHENDDTRHLTQGQIDKIAAAINATEALQIANQAINDAKAAIEAAAVATADSHAKDYTDTTVANAISPISARLTAVENGKQPMLTFDNTPTQNSANPVTSGGIFNALQNNVIEEDYYDPFTGETVTQPLNEALRENPQTRVNPEYFYRFKNMIENSSLEVFNGETLLPLGWDNGEVSPDASIFGTYSLKLEPNTVAKQTSKFWSHRSWMIPNTYNTEDCVFCFYHKFNPVGVKILDVENNTYISLKELDGDLNEGTASTEIIFPEVNNWSEHRCMVKFTPPATADGLRIEFYGKAGTESASYVDALMLEPYVAGEFPSIYKDGRYSISAYQILTPPPADVDRFTDLTFFEKQNAVEDQYGNIKSCDYVKDDGTTLAVQRWVDESSLDSTCHKYQTIYEKFYKADGITENYTDTWHFTYNAAGVELTAYKTTNEVVS